MSENFGKRNLQYGLGVNMCISDCPRELTGSSLCILNDKAEPFFLKEKCLVNTVLYWKFYLGDYL